MQLNFSLKSQELFNLFGLPITNSLFWSFFLSFLLIVGAFIIVKNLKNVPSKGQSLFEAFFEFALNLSKSTMKNDKDGKKVFPLFFTFFIFILSANLFTYLPGQAAFSLKGDNTPVFRAIFSDYAITLSFTLLTVILCQIISITVNGFGVYAKKFLNFKDPLSFFLGFMNLVGELAKVLSMSFRLFGNIFASEILTTVVLALAPFVLPVPFALLGLIGAVIQAFVFSLLSLIFVAQASTIEENEVLENASI
jgi:F-type H+-transporting ATPase subunit a